MGIETYYICEHCNTKSDSNEQYWWVWIGFIRENKSRSPAHQHATKRQLWCRSCLVSVLGFLPHSRKDPDPPEKEPTLEERIKLLIHDEIAEFEAKR